MILDIENKISEVRAQEQYDVTRLEGLVNKCVIDQEKIQFMMRDLEFSN